jgi:hypothetical protein
LEFDQVDSLAVEDSFNEGKVMESVVHLPDGRLHREAIALTLEDLTEACEVHLWI